MIMGNQVDTLKGNQSCLDIHGVRKIFFKSIICIEEKEKYCTV